MHIHELNRSNINENEAFCSARFESALAPLFTSTWSPPADTPTRGVILLTHGMESHLGWFEPFAPHLAAAGYRVHAYDRAGWGRSPGACGHLSRAEDALSELEGAINAATCDGLPLHGVSLAWGGLILGAALAAFPSRFAGVTLLVPPLFNQHTMSSPFHKLRVAFSAFTHGDQMLPLSNATSDFARDVGLRGWIAADHLRCMAVTSTFMLQSIRLARMARHGLRLHGKERALLLVTDEDPMILTPQIKRFAAKHSIPCEAVTGCRHSLVLEAPEATARRIIADIEERASSQPRSPGAVMR